MKIAIVAHVVYHSLRHFSDNAQYLHRDFPPHQQNTNSPRERLKTFSSYVDLLTSMQKHSSQWPNMKSTLYLDNPIALSQSDQVLDSLQNKHLIDVDILIAKKNQFQEAKQLLGFTRAMISVLGVDEEILANSICQTVGLARMTIAKEMGTAPAQIITQEEILQFRAIPVFKIGLEITFAFIDPPDTSLRRHLQQLTGSRVLPVITTVSDFNLAVKQYTGSLDKLQRLSSNIDLKKLESSFRRNEGGVLIESPAGESNMESLVNELLLRAAKTGTSDIHIEPGENDSLVRFRIDGVLQKIITLPKEAHASMIAILKGKSGMDMFERSIPLDGRMSLNFADRCFDVRISTLPLLYGEKMVLRVLSKTAMMVNLENLGFSEGNLKKFRSLLALPNGIVLVTGPTGSGKTTTLYAGLNEIKGIGRNITTVENPVEYKLPLVNQTQVIPERGLTFATALRAILRQDPNVILIGEIRDVETGTIATEAALTGHLVLSTLHTNDAIGAIPRMINLGIESFWVSSSIIGVVSQRLVRRICVRCREEYLPDENSLQELGLDNFPRTLPMFRGRGCEYCNGIGYKGRVAIHEVLVITEEMREIIIGEVTSSKIRALALASGYKDLFYDGLQKAIAGITTTDELLRVARH
ncbi:MAG: GspE/PulE family protein [bacterium]